jgi:hypothetical protein
MAEETIICSQCNKELVMKFIDLKDLTFCSNQCLDQYTRKVGQREFNRKYADVFVPGEGKGWVPKYANEYIQMCMRCPKKLSETCQAEMDLSATHHDSITESENYRWCCHARFCLSSGLSDGTVPLEAALKVQRYAEEKAKKQNIKGVTPVILAEAFADMVKNFDYQKLPENLPEVKPMTISHFGACLLCDAPFGQQCEALCEREFALLDKAKSLVKKVWCAHTVNVLADMLIDRESGQELLVNKVIPFADKVAEEKGHPGVITRDLFISLGRML